MFSRIAADKREELIHPEVLILSRPDARRLVQVVLRTPMNKLFVDTLTELDRESAIPYEIRVKVNVPRKGLNLSGRMRVEIPKGNRGRKLKRRELL